MVRPYKCYFININTQDLALCELFNQLPTYFHKLFTAAFGVTPANHVLGYRISAAKAALVEGALPLVEIAAQCGFSSQTYFCYRFRLVTGQTPAQYRKGKLKRMKE